MLFEKHGHTNRNVSLVLNLSTGLVSPQFHVKHDPSFDVAKQQFFKSQWQAKAGFLKEEDLLQINNDNNISIKKNIEPIIKPIGQRPNDEISKKRKARFAEPIQKKSAKVTQGRNLGPSQTKEKAAASTIRAGTESSKKTSIRPVRITRSMTVRPARQAKISSTLPQLIEVQLAEMNTQYNSNSENYVEGEIFCYMAQLKDDDDKSRIINEPLLAYKATADPDTLYLHEAMKQKDWKEFRKAMQKEVDDRMEDKNFSVTHKSKIPKNALVLPAVWALKRKRDIKTGKIKKYKARLNIDGSRMKQGIHYDQSYAPVASWNSIRLLLILTAVHGWYTKQLDYVAAFPQAPVERELYMKIPKGLKLAGKDSENYVLKLHKNTYGQKNAGRVWNEYLVKKLKQIGFKQSKIDECVFYKGKVMYVLYTDDSILAGPDQKEIQNIIKLMKQVKLDVTEEGTLEDFLGVNISRKTDGSIPLTQPNL